MASKEEFESAFAEKSSCESGVGGALLSSNDESLTIALQWTHANDCPWCSVDIVMGRSPLLSEEVSHETSEVLHDLGSATALEAGWILHSAQEEQLRFATEKHRKRVQQGETAPIPSLTVLPARFLPHVFWRLSLGRNYLELLTSAALSKARHLARESVEGNRLYFASPADAFEPFAREGLDYCHDVRSALGPDMFFDPLSPMEVRSGPPYPEPLRRFPWEPLAS